MRSLAGHRAQDALDRLVHAGQAEGVVEVVERRRQEAARRLEDHRARESQQAGGHRRHAELPLERVGLCGVVRPRLPDPAVIAVLFMHPSAMPTSPIARHLR